MRKAFVFSFFFLYSLSLFSIIAYPFRVKINTINGYTYITMMGNEYMKYAKTDDGFCIIQDSVGWKYLMRDANGKLSISKFGLADVASNSSALQTFLSSAYSVKEVTSEDFRTQIDTLFIKTKVKDLKPVTGNRKALIVMVEFTDCSFIKSNEDFNQLFNVPGYSTDGAEGSVYDFYKYVSYGQLDLRCDIIGPFTASHDMAYYGKNVGMGGHDKNPYELFKEALKYAVTKVSLSDYDANGDGIVDNFHIIYAGYGEEAGASANAIWAHESTFEPLSVDGMKIDRYSCAPELRSNRGSGISRIGPHCHEIGHALGAMDYYDTDYEEGGKYLGTGKWDVMASGSWNNDGITPSNFNSYVKSYNFGWTNVVTIQKDTTFLVNPSTNDNIVYRINTPVNNDYFLLENRRLESFDSENPGEGLLILHVGPNLENKSGTNSINATFPQNCYYVCASASVVKPSSSPSSYGNVNSDGCPFPGSSNNNNFTPTTLPAALCVNGLNANFSLLNIQELIDESIRMDYVAGSDTIGTTPEETDIPLTGEIVWEENFKGVTLPNGWIQECIIGNTQWVKRMSAKGGLVNFAELAFEASPWESDNYISTELITHTFEMPPIDYVLSYDVNRISYNEMPDTLLVSLGNDECLIKNVLLSEGWETKSCIIRANQEPFKIHFNGIVNKSSAIRLTNMKIRKFPITDGIKSNVWDRSSKETSVYSIYGQKRSKEQRGINIVRMADGTYKKIFDK